MDPAMIGFWGIAILIVLLILGFPVFIAMAVTGTVGFYVITGNVGGAGALAAGMAYSVGSTYEFSVMPFFILLGMIVYESGTATSIYEAAYRWVGKIPAGLGIATCLAVAFFSAVSGSSMACAVTFSKIAIPQLVSKGYNKSLACGLIAGAATQDALIPPSALLVIYAIVTEQSIGKCLMAGFLPGLLSCLLYIIALVILGIYRTDWVPRGASFTMKEKVESLKGAWQIPLLAVIILYAIYSGICTPTEAAGFGTFVALVMAASLVGFKRLNLRQSLRSTVISSTMIYAILFGAFVFGSFMSVSNIPNMLSNIIKTAGLGREVVLAIIIILYFVMGCFMSPTAMVVISMPIFFPVITALRYDPIWFGIIVVKMAGIGMLTPPVGMSVYAVKGTVKDLCPLEDIFKGSMIFLIMDLITLFLLIIFPSISTILPDMMGK
ncbi:MAG: TRAP transporter large permease [Pseudomonadota bacterium]